ncbi:hypothetical protein ELQ90_03875 [Labedella phragmitis]|uniref:Uncharacterized protein n=1 Tax=Labedella phragmitis TaxID=2498849 RepID=A0A3S4APK1_9MICO|nr:hypothetical protein [Labedella phragmitis]RWZ53072.1 hypothetical protein ELQ90_03875 [Labedella phragmitis]
MTSDTTNSGPQDSGDLDAEDELLREHAIQTVATDGVAGETVLPGTGDGNNGPTGGAPREPEPGFAENDLAGEEIDLDETAG